MNKLHTFHIPVMGIGYTIDTPVRVAHLGIDSSISLVDDILIEKMRQFYCETFKIPYEEITQKMEDYRARRITSYLDIMHDLASDKLEDLKSAFQEKKKDFQSYFSSFPDGANILSEFNKLSEKANVGELKSWLNENLKLGSIDVNIMTKVDRTTYRKGEELPVEFNDAHAALRGFAQSKLSSSVILSAGMNTRLYSYIENFKDFFPDAQGNIKKKIVLKVSDFKSALVQGKFLAKKGLWVSEYRVESGLNCGGHAFAKDGFLMGPILEEFKTKRTDLFQSVREVLDKGLTLQNKLVPEVELTSRISAQGGVGTSDEHQFLMDEYEVDSVGWGSPFLLVPEVTAVDEDTRAALAKAREEDLYLSNISPLGVPFNSLRGNTKDIEKQGWIDEGKPGSPCPKQFVKLNTDFEGKALCTASRQYQKKKIDLLKAKDISAAQYQFEYKNITDKSCVCVGLGTSSMLEKSIDTKGIGNGVSVCPGPNIAYYEQNSTLNEMVGHIYGQADIPYRQDRPHMFIKELNIYIDFLKQKLEDAKFSMDVKQTKQWSKFSNNIDDGIKYYQGLFGSMKGKFESKKNDLLEELAKSKTALLKIGLND